MTLTANRFSFLSVTFLLLLSACNSGKFEVSGSTLLNSTSGSLQAPSTGGTPAPGATATPAPAATATPAPVTADSTYLRGINIMDLGSAGDYVPGTYGKHYTKPSADAIKALHERGGHGVLRIPFLWERVQPTLGGGLDSTYLGYMMQVLRDANTTGVKIILDMHNYARYRNASNNVNSRFGDDAGPTQAQYADVWKKIVVAVRADASAYNAVYAFDLMNEPYDLPSVGGMTPQRLWEVYAQAAVSGIRSAGETKLIMVEGYSFASAELFPTFHPSPFISDSANNIMYEAHSYLDNDSSGTFTASHDQELANAKQQGFASVSARGIYRVKKFTDWLATNKVRGFLGEYGWPNSDVKGSSDAASWNQTGEELMTFMDSVKLGATMWATGSWLGPTTNVLNAYVLPGNADNVYTPLSQTSVLEKHPGGK